ncbi:LOB domain-containing protein 33-like [Forsythia ovata]|uniref:LOB domain-containing protein 33-like n=1 Tax=Forsythia ovata TaxID=205694 RepID=A0ABD1WGN6_9LAMI
MTGLGSSCGACKFLRRRCTSECVFAPYFSYCHAASHFSAVHKVFGASNVSKLLLHLPVQNRSDAAITLSYEALARMQDPIYGCVAHILALQKLVASLEEEIEIIGNQMANLEVDAPSYETSQETNIPNNVLQFSSGYNIIGDHIDQQSLQLQQPGNLSANQACSSQMNIQFPQGNVFEDDIFQAYYDSSVIDRFYEELNQDIYQHSQWMCSTLNSI